MILVGWLCLFVSRAPRTYFYTKQCYLNISWTNFKIAFGMGEKERNSPNPKLSDLEVDHGQTFGLDVHDHVVTGREKEKKERSSASFPFPSCPFLFPFLPFLSLYPPFLFPSLPLPAFSLSFPPSTLPFLLFSWEHQFFTQKLHLTYTTIVNNM